MAEIEDVRLPGDSSRDAGLVDAARFERDSRAGRYPALVAAGKLDAGEATVAFQCWVVIAEWLESGRFVPFYHGGIDGNTVIGWAACEAAAGRSLAQLNAKADNMAEGDPAFADTRRRRAALDAIHRAVQLRRAMIDQLNRELRERAQEIAA